MAMSDEVGALLVDGHFFYDVKNDGDKARFFKIITKNKNHYTVLDEDYKCGHDEPQPLKKCFEMLKEDECRYGVVRLTHEDVRGETVKMVALISWIPDGAQIMEKMLYHQFLDKFEGGFPGLFLVNMKGKDDMRVSDFLKHARYPVTRFEGKRYRINPRSGEYESAESDEE